MLNIKQSDGEHVLFNEQIKDFLVITYDLYLNNKALTHIYIYIAGQTAGPNCLKKLKLFNIFYFFYFTGNAGQLVVNKTIIIQEKQV